MAWHSSLARIPKDEPCILWWRSLLKSRAGSRTSRAPVSARLGDGALEKAGGSRGHGVLSNSGESEENRCESNRPANPKAWFPLKNFAAGQTPVLPCTQPAVTLQEQRGRRRPPRRSWEGATGRLQREESGPGPAYRARGAAQGQAQAQHPPKKTYSKF